MAEKATLKRSAPNEIEQRLSKSRNTESAQSPNESELNFFDLPPEIRDMIYGYALIEDHTILVHTNEHVTNEHWREPGILRASKQTRNETIMIYYKRNKFEINIDPFETREASCWTDSVFNNCRSKTFVPFVPFNIYHRIHYGEDPYNVLFKMS